VVKEGQTLNAIQTAPTIVKLAQVDKITVSAQISEADVMRVKPGQKVYFTILGNPDKRYYGKLRSIDPAPTSIESDTNAPVSSSTSSSGSTSNAIYYNALFDVPNPDRELRISMTAQVYGVLGEAHQATVIPSAALGEKARDGSYVVFVLNAQGKPVPRKITVGINNNAVAQILSGLAVGEQVVVGEADVQGADAAPHHRPRMF